MLGKVVTVANAWVTAATVPANETWIVKSASIFNGSAGIRDCRIYVDDFPGSNNAVLVFQNVATGAVAYWTGWTVAGPGNRIQVYADAAGVNFWVSGAKLPGFA